MVHELSIAYAPTTNAIAERVGRTFLDLMRCLLQELRLPPAQWPALLPAVNSSLNATPSPSRSGFSPQQLMLGGRVVADPLRAVVSNREIQTVDLTKDSFHTFMARLQTDMDERVNLVYGEHTVRAHQEAFHRGETHAPYEPDDLVMIKDTRTSRRKLQAKFNGPFLVKSAKGRSIFELTDPLKPEKAPFDVHEQRIFFYDKNGVSDAVLESLRYQSNVYDIERVVEVRNNHGNISMLIHWHGFGASDRTWVPAETVLEDAPLVVETMLQNPKRVKGLSGAIRKILQRELQTLTASKADRS